jgi:hypothetical protein
MSISDEQLDAYMDGELSEAQRSLIAQAIVQDANLAQRVARQQALRERLRKHFDGVLQEPVPDRLIGLVKGAKFDAMAPLADLAAARNKRRLSVGSILTSKPGWYAIAASILVGSIAGLLMARWNSGTDLTTFKDGKLIARGALASALDEQLASAIPPNASVHISLSFKARSGRYCRTFDIAGAEGTAGLACYDEQHWRVLTLIGEPAKEGTDPAFRMAGSEIPPLLLQSVNENISGEPLDAQAEMRARSAGWH